MNKDSTPKNAQSHSKDPMSSAKDSEKAKGYTLPIRFPDLVDVETTTNFKQTITNCVQSIGFSDYFFVPDLSGERPHFLSSVPQALTDRYFSEDMHKSDMLLYHAAHHENPLFASSLHKYLLSAPIEDTSVQRQKQIHQWFKAFGFYDAYVVPIVSSECSERSVIFYLFRYCTPGDLARSVERQELLLSALGEEIAAAAKSHLPQKPTPPKAPRLNPKPLKVLYTLATNDLSIGDIAKKLNISIVTANKHLETARNTFDVKTNYAAIQKAVAAGLFKLV